MSPKNKCIELPSGISVPVANYKLHGLPEYDTNPLIRALPRILDDEEFVEAVQSYPTSTADERSLPAHLRYHCVERLTGPLPQGYFQPLNRHVELHRMVVVAIMQGYLPRSIASPDHATRVRQIHQALVKAEGHNLDKYLTGETSAREHPTFAKT